MIFAPGPVAYIYGGLAFRAQKNQNPAWEFNKLCSPIVEFVTTWKKKKKKRISIVLHVDVAVSCSVEVTQFLPTTSWKIFCIHEILF